MKSFGKISLVLFVGVFGSIILTPFIGIVAAILLALDMFGSDKQPKDFKGMTFKEMMTDGLIGYRPQDKPKK